MKPLPFVKKYNISVVAVFETFLGKSLLKLFVSYLFAFSVFYCFYSSSLFISIIVSHSIVNTTTTDMLYF